MEAGRLTDFMENRSPTMSERGFNDYKLYFVDLTLSDGHTYLLVEATSATQANRQAHDISKDLGLSSKGGDVRRAKPEDLDRDDYVYIPTSIRDTRAKEPKLAKTKVAEIKDVTIRKKDYPSIVSDWIKES